MIGVIGVGGRMGGMSVVTLMVLRFLSEYGFSHKFYDLVDMGALFKVRAELRRLDVLLFILGWYYFVYLIADFIRSIRDVKKVGYLVTEGDIPIGLHPLLEEFDRIIVPSNYAYNFYKRVYHDGLTVVPHGIDTETFKPAEERPYDVSIVLPSTIGFGVNIHRKGTDILREALKALSGYRVKVIGNKWVRHYEGVTDCIESVEYGDIAKVYQQSKVFLWTSRCEGFGLPPLEAMACGCPVVYSNAPAHNEFCVGIAVPVNHVKRVRPFEAPIHYYSHETSPSDYVEPVLHLLENPTIREELGEEAREKAQAYDYRTLYGKLLSEVLS